MSYPAQHGFRPEIQGLRAWAVMLVTVFHLWPSVLPGGFVGVDVFFVISGYLITRLLMREAERDRDISLTAFYARRIRRLLPAASLVLLTVAACMPMIPRVLWEQNVPHLISSALYVENWWLAYQAADYFGAEETPGVVQHYWSLAVEEQFYLIWPLLMLWLCRRAWKTDASARKHVFRGLTALTLASFTLSVWLTHAGTGNAYFFTHTRLWELGMGGLLAVSRLAVAGAAWRKTAAVAGLALILASACMLTGESAFPGWLALFPVAGAALVILSEGEGRPGGWLLKAPPLQFLGDISYAMYLWHWPLIVWWRAQAGEVRPGEMTVGAGLLLLAVSIALAWLTRKYVEEYFLRRAVWLDYRPRLYQLGGALTGICVMAAAGIYGYIHGYVHYTADRRASTADYPGGTALVYRMRVPEGKEPIPPLLRVKQDKPDLYRKDCHVDYEDSRPVPCEYGVRGGAEHVVLVGDSRAAQWLPALDAIARENGWRLTLFTKSACPLLDAKVGEKQPYEDCYRWGRQVVAWIKANKPQLLLQAQSREALAYLPGAGMEERRAATRDAILTVWDDLEREGIRIVALRDAPLLRGDPNLCVRDGGRHCAFSTAEALGYDPLLDAAIIDRTIPYIDMTDGICERDYCRPVVGNVMVWRDSLHLTATYAATLAPVLGQRLNALLSHWDGDGAVGGYPQ